MFDSRLSVELDLYNNVTSDLLLPVPTPYTAGDASNPNVNVGEVTNRGLDLGLNYSGGSGDFFYSIGGNFSIYRNEVTGLNDPDARLFGRADRLTSPATVTQVGAPLSSYYGLQVDGIFQTQTEADAHVRPSVIPTTMHPVNSNSGMSPATSTKPVTPYRTASLMMTIVP